MFPDDVIAAASALLDACRAAGLKIVTAESCTGGLLAGALTEVAGASDVVDCGFITYSNDAKSGTLGVAEELIAKHGAVSDVVAREMAIGALEHSNAGIAIAVTGVAGPTGGTSAKPVGLVYIAVQRLGREPVIKECHFGDIGRSAVRLATVREAIQMALSAATGKDPG